MVDICFLDVDGVLVDFYGRTLEVLGLTLEEVRKATPAGPGHWNYFEPFMSENEFWRRLGAVPDFWEGLRKTPEADHLLDACQQLFGDRVYLLTSPPLDPRSVAGKVSWVKEHLPDFYRRLIVSPAKQAFAHTGSFLVDDSEDNVNKFREHSGKAILVPRFWNSLHEYEGDLVNVVRGSLLSLQEGRGA